MPVTLYKRQRELLDFITRYIDQFGYAPTLNEIAQELKLRSLATVHEHLAALEKKGLIRKFEGSVRGIELINQKISQITSFIELPLLGFIAAGNPIEPYTDPNATFSVAPSLISNKKRSFVLQVKGNSMIEDGILDGDYIVCEEQSEARNGEIVVALLDNGVATLKRFYREPTRIRLEPANREMKPIYAQNVTIQGKCVGVIRQYH